MMKVKLTMCAAATALLVGCGGGGGDAGGGGVVVPTGPRTGVTASAGSNVDAGNYLNTIAAPVVRMLMRAGEGATPGLSGGRESPQRASPATAALSARWVASLAARAAPREQATAVQTIGPETCDFGGTITITVNDADNNNRLSAGDSMTIVANNCVAEFGQPAINGTLGMTINAVELAPDLMPTALDISASATNLSVQGFGSMNGNFRVWMRPITATSDRLRVSYLNTVVNEPNVGSITYNLDIDGTSGDAGGSFEVSGGIGIGGQTYVINTSAAFVYDAGSPPRIGTLTVRDAAGDAARITAKSATTLDVDFVVNGVVQASSPGLAWSSFEL